MRAFFDTEHVRWKSTPLTLASIGIIRSDGRELYLVSSELRRSKAGPWFKKNVWPHLEREPKVSLAEMSDAVQEFLIPVSQMVTRGGQNDFKLLEQLAGPAWFRQTDIETIWTNRGRPLLPRQMVKAHHALADARWYRTLFYHLHGLGIAA